MDSHDQPGIGGDIGTEAAKHVDRHSASYCASERQRIETVNRPAILALRATSRPVAGPRAGHRRPHLAGSRRRVTSGRASERPSFAM